MKEIRLTAFSRVLITIAILGSLYWLVVSPYIAKQNGVSVPVTSEMSDEKAETPAAAPINSEAPEKLSEKQIAAPVQQQKKVVFEQRKKAPRQKNKPTPATAPGILSPSSSSQGALDLEDDEHIKPKKKNN